MATAANVRPRIARDSVFYFTIALVMTATVIVGFGTNALLGRVDIAHLPLWLHLHALVFFSWILLYTYQNWLILRGNVERHRRLGWIGAGLAVGIVVVGETVSLLAVHIGLLPFFFTPPYFLAMALLTLLGFGGLVTAAIALRRRTEWHRRLLLCATILLINPAWGRLVPMPLMGEVAGNWAVCAALLLYVGWGMIHDLRVRGHVHPAYYWGGGVIVAWQVLILPLSFTAPIQALAHALTA